MRTGRAGAGGSSVVRSRRSPGPSVVFRLLRVALPVFVPVLFGCDANPLRSVRNPYYRRGYKLLQERKHVEAAEAFQRSLRLDPDTAMANLQLGILYEDTFEDPAAALYQYQEFLRKRPESSRAEAVRRWRQRAQKALYARLAEKYGAPQTDRGTERSGPAANAASGTGRERGETEKERILTRRVRELTFELVRREQRIVELERELAAARRPPDPVQEEGSGSVADGTGRRPGAGGDGEHGSSIHVIQAGDTLSSISRRYYGSLKYWPQLREANRDVLGGSDRLIKGRTLRIPPLDALPDAQRVPARDH